MRIGIDLGGTKIEAVILDANGDTLWRQRLPTATLQNNDLEAAYQQTQQIIAELLQRGAELFPAIKKLPLGIGTPGAECADGTLKNCNSIWLNGRTLRSDLENTLQRPVRMANDANCFALAEARLGAAQNASSVFGVILGTGVGGGVVLHGQLHQGANHIAGEWGHNRLPMALPAEQRSANEIAETDEQRACYCGRYNCVETFLSGPGLSHSYFLASQQQCTAVAIVDKLQQGETCARLVWQQYVQQLARALGQVINVLDPELIVLGGGLSNIHTLYREVPQFWSPYIFSREISTRLVQAQLGDSAGVFGAAYLW